MLNLANYHNSPDRSTKSTRLDLMLLATGFAWRQPLITQRSRLFVPRPFSCFGLCPYKLRSSCSFARPRFPSRSSAPASRPARSVRKPTPSNTIVLPQFVNTGFQVLFHSPPGVLFTFPSRYCSTIGHQVVFRLGGWSPRIPIGFHVSDGTPDTASCLSVSSTGLSPSPVDFPTSFGYILQSYIAVRTPKILLPSV